ncbi:hypothetical protein DFH07DRAFT_777434 [Mycena maculata]|uniref:Uncharacterized protein n=1 Tax=Mycena maculata TaxID=230809 RepID=A0AAD7II84_9AGAR|nr:hypothetical protein DFH07DRAFT_777434 [Mycena maculata]
MFDFVQSHRKILDPIERAEATYNLRPYKPEVPGVVYTNYRANHKILDGVATAPTDEEVDWVDLKAGLTNDIDRRRGEYTRDCKGEEIAWAYYYPTNRPKLLVRQRPWSISPCGPDWPTASRIRAMAAGSATGDTDAQAAAHDLFGIAGARDLRRCWRGSYATCTSSRKRGITGAQAAAPDLFGVGGAGKHKEARDRILNIESGTAGSSAADDERDLWRAGKHKEAPEDILNIESGTTRSTAADDECGLWRAGKHKEARQGILNIESLSCLKSSLESTAF